MRRTGALALAVIILVAGLATSAGAANLIIKGTYTGPMREYSTDSYSTDTMTIVITEQTLPSAAGTILFKGTVTSKHDQDNQIPPVLFTGQMSNNNIFHVTVRDGQTGTVIGPGSGEFSAITWTLKGVLQKISSDKILEFVVKK